VLFAKVLPGRQREILKIGRNFKNLINNYFLEGIYDWTTTDIELFSLLNRYFTAGERKFAVISR